MARHPEPLPAAERCSIPVSLFPMVLHSSQWQGAQCRGPPSARQWNQHFAPLAAPLLVARTSRRCSPPLPPLALVAAYRRPPYPTLACHHPATPDAAHCVHQNSSSSTHRSRSPPSSVNTSYLLLPPQCQLSSPPCLLLTIAPNAASSVSWHRCHQGHRSHATWSPTLSPSHPSQASRRQRHHRHRHTSHGPCPLRSRSCGDNVQDCGKLLKN